MARVRKTTKSRTRDAGYLLVEMLIAVATSAMLAGALVGAMSDAMRFSTDSYHLLLATAVAQEQIDNIRNTPYGNIIPGTYTLLLNQRLNSDVSPNYAGSLYPVHPGPLLYDLLDYDWRTPAEKEADVNQTACKASTTFQYLGQSDSQESGDALVTQVVSAGQVANTLLVTITVKWTESGDVKTYTVDTVIAQYGIHLS